MKVSEIKKPFQSMALASGSSGQMKQNRADAGDIGKQYSTPSRSRHFFLNSKKSIPWLRGRQSKVLLVSFKTVIDAGGQLQSEPEDEEGNVSSDNIKLDLDASKVKFLSKKRRINSGGPKNRRRRRVQKKDSMVSRLKASTPTIRYGANMPTYHDTCGDSTNTTTSFEIQRSESVSLAAEKKSRPKSIRVTIKSTKSTPGASNQTVNWSSKPLPAITIKQEFEDSTAITEDNIATSTSSNTPDLATVAIEYFQNAQKMVQLRAQLQQSDLRKKRFSKEIDLAQQQIREVKNSVANLMGKCNKLGNTLQKECNSLQKVKKEIETVRSQQCQLLIGKSGFAKNSQLRFDLDLAVKNTKYLKEEPGMANIAVKVEPESE